MFGSNKEEKKNQSTSLHNNPDIMKLFALDKDKKGEGKVWGDRYLDKIKPSNVPSNQKNRLINIGSQNTNHNSLIVEDEGITIQPQIWWDEWTGENKPKESKKDENGYAMAIKRFEIINDDIVLLKEDTKYKFSDLEISEGDSSSEVAKELEKLKYKKPGAVLEVDNARTSKYFYNFTKKGDLFIKPEIEKILRNRLSGGVAVDKVDTIKVDTIIPAELSLEVDGIGGLQPGDICQTDYIQPKYNVNFYKDDKEFGPFTYFQIVGINQKVDSTGWITEVETKMRINHIPDVHNLQVSTSETIQEEVEAKDDPVVRIDKVEAEPDYPENKILPDDDDDEITNVKLDQLDFEDFPKWDVPLGPPPQRGLTNIPTKAGTFKVGSFEEFVDTENLRANTSNQILLPRISRYVS